jgi:hypothetical protein
MWENGEHEHSCTSISNPVTSLGFEMHIAYQTYRNLNVQVGPISMCSFYLPQAKNFEQIGKKCSSRTYFCVFFIYRKQKM